MGRFRAEALASALDLWEHETGLHSKRVACDTLELAQRSIHDAPERLRQIYWGAVLYDIGKIGIPDAILLKEGPLTDSEWQEMRTHPEKGFRIVSKMLGMQDAAEIVLSHEERFDGTGDSRGLSEESVPWGGRLFAVIDPLDAMTLDRPYEKVWISMRQKLKSSGCPARNLIPMRSGFHGSGARAAGNGVPQVRDGFCERYFDGPMKV